MGGGMSGTRAGALKGWETRRRLHRPTKRNEARAVKTPPPPKRTKKQFTPKQRALMAKVLRLERKADRAGDRRVYGMSAASLYRSQARDEELKLLRLNKDAGRYLTEKRLQRYRRGL